MDSEVVMERALEDANVPTLMVAVAQLTSDLSLIREAGTLVFGWAGDPQGKLSPEFQARARRHAFEALARYRAAGSPPIPPLAPEVVRELMTFIGGRPIPDEYLAFLMEELGLPSAAPSQNAATAELPSQAREQFHVLVIGAGMSGLAAAVRLKQAGVPFTVLEKNADVGGTWLENTYPGCRVDLPNHIYSYSFEPNHDWPQYYSSQSVLLAYFQRVAARHDLHRRIRFQTEVQEAVWDEADALWRVRVRNVDGSSETLTANAVVSAVGQLNRPNYPEIAGRERFAGVSFHSACWNHDYDLTDKRVAVIGTGASALQFVPAIAGRTRELLVFQRSAPWLLPTPNYVQDVPEGMKWLLHNVPNYERWYRFWLFWLGADGMREYVTADADWKGASNAIGVSNDLLRKTLNAYIKMQVKDPALRAAVTPSYPPGGKRMLRDSGAWFAALKRDNVRLITERIEAIDERCVRTSDGQAHAVDAIIYGTGFAASDFLQTIRVVGRGGRVLSEHWDGDARAYLGMTIPSFPNLFLMYGPNTNIVVNGSIIFFSECATQYIVGCIDLLLRSGRKSLDVRADVHDAYNERVDAENARMAWGAPAVSSWYKNKHGRVSQNWPFPLIDYWAATRRPARRLHARLKSSSHCVGSGIVRPPAAGVAESSSLIAFSSSACTSGLCWAWRSATNASIACWRLSRHSRTRIVSSTSSTLRVTAGREPVNFTML